MRTVRVTVVVLCVCVCVHSYLLPHTLESQKRDTNEFTAIHDRFNFCQFSLKCFIQKVWHNMPTSSSSGVLEFFSSRNKLLYWFEAHSYIFTAQTTGLWKTACNSLAQMRENGTDIWITNINYLAY